MSARTDWLPERATWIPDGITREQFDEYRRLHLESIRALGLDPNYVCENGTRRDGDTVIVEFIVPPESWDGTGMVPAEPDPWRPYSVRRGQVTLRIKGVEA